MLALRLPPEIEKRLNDLARKTGRTKSSHAREAIVRYVEDLEDYDLAMRRLARRNPTISLEVVEAEIGNQG